MRETQRRRRGHNFTPPKKVTSRIPALGATDGIPAEEKVIHAHFFSPGTDLYVAELSEREEDGHVIAFGYSVLAGHPEGAEWGYTDLTEMEAVNVRTAQGLSVVAERDCHWSPQPFSGLGAAEHQAEEKATPAEAGQTTDVLARHGTAEQRRDYALTEARRLHDEARTQAQSAGDVPAAVSKVWLEYQEADACAENDFRDQTRDRAAAEPSQPVPAAEPEGDMTRQERDRAAEFTDGYRRGRADAWNGTLEPAEGRGERHAAGYARGHKWGSDHPAPYGRGRAAEQADPVMQARLARGRASLEAAVGKAPPAGVLPGLEPGTADEAFARGWSPDGGARGLFALGEGVIIDDGPAERQLNDWNIANDHAEDGAGLDYEAE
jgi:hypothetical protein